MRIERRYHVRVGRVLYKGGQVKTLFPHHAPLFASQPDVKRYVCRYIQCHVTGDRPEGPKLGETDGIVELWFDDIEGFKAFGNSGSYLEVIRPDEERFTDPTRCDYPNRVNSPSRK